MRAIAWALWLVLFILLFAFALHNTSTTEVKFFGGLVWQAPLIAFLLVFFLGGVVFGFLAMLPTWFRLRMEVRRLRKSATKATAPVDKAVGATGPTTIQSVAQGARTTN